MSVQRCVRVGWVCAVALGAALGLAMPLAAQTPPEGLTFTTVDPPRGDSGTAYDRSVRGRAQTEATYATEVHGGRLTVDSRAPRRPVPQFSPPALGGNWAMLAVVGGLALALFLWLRFGGGGLLARTPAPDRAAVQAPDAWNLTGAEDRLSGDALLAHIAAMSDRRAAMVRLLRHCLLHAAGATETRLARSDTERRALARLPEGFRLRPLLADLLARAELAHYGGREVAEADFAASLTAARALLGVGHA